MSRIGKKPIALANSVTVTQQDRTILVKGPKGELSLALPETIDVQTENQTVTVQRKSDEKFSRALHGTVRSLLANMVKGVTEGFQKELQIEGVGYRAQVKGKALSLQLGFSHPIDYPIPEGITIQTPTQTQILIQGIDKAKVGEVASEIRAFLKPEPYKGKGIRYAGEVIRRKAGKTVA